MYYLDKSIFEWQILQNKIICGAKRRRRRTKKHLLHALQGIVKLYLITFK
jgi:hypothetical protein